MEWANFKEESIPNDGVVWIRYANLQNPIKTHFVKGQTNCREFYKREDHKEIKNVIYRK